MGSYLGGTFNCVFFSLSAILFGEKMSKTNDTIKLIPFMRQRLYKLAASLWPMLAVALIIFYVIKEPFSAEAALMNFCFMGWFTKLPGLGHLWFVTMIVLCYILFVVLANLRKNISVYWIWPAMIITIICSYVVSLYKMPGYLFLILFYCSILFIYGAYILKWAESVSYWILTSLTWFINGITIMLFYMGQLQNGRLETYYITAMCGILILLWLYRLFHIYRPGPFIVFFSGISYQLYLVHHPFCFGKFSIFRLTGEYWYIGILLIFILSILLALLLKRIADSLYRH